MPNYHTLLACDPHRRAAIDALVERLQTRGPHIQSRFSEAGRNLEKESNLSELFWRQFADFLLGDGNALSLPAIESSLAFLFRSFQKQGPPVSTGRKRHGRVVKQADFVDMLIRDKARLPRSTAEDLADQLIRASTEEAAALLEFQPLGRFLMWSTYCEDCDCEDPFHPRDLADHLIDSLGLRFRNGDEFLLMVYEIPANVNCFTPTIADAYGGNFFFPFRPGGRTHPIRYQEELSGRPEIVHEPVTGNQLRRPIEALAPDDSIATGASKCP